MMSKRSLLSLLAVLLVFSAFSQGSAIGEWRAHLPYRDCRAVESAGDLIYVATPFSLFVYDKTENSVNLMSKINGLSDVEISTIAYSQTYKTLLVAYTNANIDLITADGIINISDIKRKNIFGSKTIHSILFLNNYAYLSCGFGIVVLDMSRQEIYDTYLIGPGGSSMVINDLTYLNNRFYAATVNGIYSADASSHNLADYNSWTKDTTLRYPNGNYSLIETYNDKLIAVQSMPNYGDDTLLIKRDTSWEMVTPGRTDDYYSLRTFMPSFMVCGNSSVEIFDDSLNSDRIVYTYLTTVPGPADVYADGEGVLWIADRYSGLVRNFGWDFKFIQPNGPGSHYVYSLTAAGDDLWVAPGSTNTALGNTYNTKGPFSLVGDVWYTLKDYNPSLDSLYDILYMAVDPSNYKHVYAASWGNGLLEFQDGMLIHQYTYTNSGLQKPFSFYNWVGVGGIAFDDNGYLWVINDECNQLLKVLKPDGNWGSYNVSSLVSQAKATRLMVDSHHQKWIMLYASGGIIVYNDNDTPDNNSDDRMTLLSTGLGRGNLPSSNVYSFAEDLDGEVWVGTDKGLAVFYTPGNIFSGDNYDAQVITIEQDSTAQHLLEFETVTAIAVDGANKKWVGTLKAGVFLFSDDGQKEIHHFTAENSPLLSNTINDIAINSKTGEVFFGTDLGICSFKGYAVAGQDKYQGVYAYPNPVPADFDGYVGIKGLTRNSWIKITDISGNLIFETRSEGGQAVWNVKNFSGERAKTGVYPVICISEDGTEKIVTKILVVN
jgi:hypothetical protein